MYKLPIMKTQLETFNNSWYNPGGTPLKRLVWYFCNVLFFMNPLIPFSGLKVRLLRLFGATIGKGVLIKPSVNIKYPWKLTIGDHCWIGENVWIDNLDQITLEDNICLSQGAMLLCGNHDYKKSSFDLITKPITLKSGSWVGAQSIVCPGVTLFEESVLAVKSVATGDLTANTIWQGNPAQKIRQRHTDSTK